MKILYIAYERDAAALAARILHATAQDVTLTWAQAPALALQWLQANRDAAAVIVEVQAQSCGSFVEQLRGLGLTTPVVVVAGSARPESVVAALNSGADGCVVSGPSLETDLPRTLAMAIDRERGRREHLAQALTELGAARDRAEQRLAQAEEALRQAETRSASELSAAAARLADVQARHTVALARDGRICTALQQRLFELESALRKADERRASEAGTYADQLAKRHAEFTASLAHAARSRDTVAAELSAATAALEEARQARRADAAAAAEDLRRREAEFGAALAEAVAARATLEGVLAEADASHRDTRQRAEIDLAAANERQAALEDLLTQEADRRTDLDRKLAAVETARQEAEERHAAELARVASQVADLQTRYDAAVQEHSAARATFEEQLAAAAAALDRDKRERVAEAAAAAERLATLEAEFGARLAEASAARAGLERALTDAQSVQQHALDRAAEYQAAAAARQTTLEQQLAQEADRSRSLEGHLVAAESARHEAEERHAGELARIASQVADLQARYDAAVQEHSAARATFEEQLAAAAAALDRDKRERVAEAAAAAERLATLEAEFGVRLAEAGAARAALERALTDAQSAQQHALDRAAEDQAAAATRQATLEQQLAQEADRSRSLEGQLVAAESARQEADRQHAAALAAAGARLASLQATYAAAVTDHAAARTALEQQVTEAAAAHREADGRTAAVLAAASAREAELVERLAAESGARAALERDLAGARMEFARRRDRSLRVGSAHRRRAREQKVQLQAQLSRERDAADRELRARDEANRATQDQLQRMQNALEQERQASERARLAGESERQRASAEYDELRRSFDLLQSAFQALEQIAGEHAAERARLDGVVADRDSQLGAESERHRVAEQATREVFEQLQAKLQQALEASGSEITRLQQEIDALGRELDATRTHAEALRGVARRVPDLEAQLELSRNERRRQFERAPFALCRCTKSGVITDANHSFVTLLGRRRIDELRNMDFTAAVFDSAGDLGWLLERAGTMRKTEAVETRWRTRDGRQLVVRLQALATTTDSIDIVVEDITVLRSLEERLRQAHRMEAVGRLASEIAVTCDGLLRDVTRGTHEWLATIGTDDARRHVEQLLADVTRAASFLRQLEVYGHEEVRALGPVSVQRVVRDLAPVLKRVVGDRIDLVLPKTAGSFDVDVEAERLERVLVTVAGYARERMPRGGQIAIDLATTAVGRRFVTRYPNVRPGDHVLITVTELPAVAGLQGDTQQASPTSDKPGLDLGALVDLIAACGGHLWMEAQPAGNMVVKIHLPKPFAADATDTAGRDAGSDRGGRLSKWFRSRSGAGLRT